MASKKTTTTKEKPKEAPAETADQPEHEPEETALAEKPKTAAEKRQERQDEAAEMTALASKAMESIADVEESSMVPFTPRDFGAAWKLAKHLSESGVVADGLTGNAGAVFSVMARGSIMGMHWSVAVTEAYVVKGRIGWPAAVMDALIDRSPGFEYFEVVSATAEKAVVEAKRQRWESPRQYEVTIQEAGEAGYLDPGGHYSQVWRTRPKLMLIAMARREAARMWDPGRFAGLYTREELMEATAQTLLDAPRATAALEDFGGQRALTAGDVEIIDPADDQAAPAPEIDAGDGRVRLTADLITRIRTALDSAPKIQEGELAHRLGCKSLEEFSGDPGTKPADLYTQALESMKALKMAAAKR